MRKIDGPRSGSARSGSARSSGSAESGSVGSSPRPVRADARRNLDALLEAARIVFAADGVDAPAKQITDRAGLGVGTLYRHFPRRSDLVKAVFQREIDACADAATMAATDPADALERWLGRVADLVATKRGLAAALHSGDPAFDDLPDYIWARLEPALDSLLTPARGAGAVRSDVDARDILRAVAHLCIPVPGEDAPAHSRRMVAVFVAGLRTHDDRRP